MIESNVEEVVMSRMRNALKTVAQRIRDENVVLFIHVTLVFIFNFLFLFSGLIIL
jgi:hypothetical protein